MHEVHLIDDPESPDSEVCLEFHFDGLAASHGYPIANIAENCIFETGLEDGIHRSYLVRYKTPWSSDDDEALAIESAIEKIINMSITRIEEEGKVIGCLFAKEDGEELYNFGLTQKITQAFECGIQMQSEKTYLQNQFPNTFSDIFIGLVLIT